MISIRAVELFAMEIAIGVSAVACSSGDDAPAEPRTPAHDAAAEAGPIADPSMPGPYAVGTTHVVFERTDSVSGEPRTLDTLVWYPAANTAGADAGLAGIPDAPGAAGGPYPLVVFSHGSGGIPNQSTFFTAHVASHGFVVVAPPHPGNTAADCIPCFDDPVKFAPTIPNRPDDVLFVFDSIVTESKRAGSVIEGLVDPSRAAMSGHSAGGWTTLEVMARDSRFKAGIPMAPATVMGDVDMSKVGVPILLMVGGLDTLTPGGKDEVQTLPGSVPYWILEMPRAGHMSFTDFCVPSTFFAGCTEADLSADAGHAIVDTYGVAFLNSVVAGRAGYDQYLEPETSLAGGEASLASRVRSP